jgi:hypothetical protein
MYEDMIAIMVSCVASCFDNVARMFFPVLLCIPCCIYVVKYSEVCILNGLP